MNLLCPIDFETFRLMDEVERSGQSRYNRSLVTQKLQTNYNDNVFVRHWFKGKYGRWIVDHKTYTLIDGYELPLPHPNASAFDVVKQQNSFDSIVRTYIPNGQTS